MAIQKGHAIRRKRILTTEQGLEVPVGRAHVGLGHGHLADEALDGQPPAAGLPQIVLVPVEAAEPQGDGHALAPPRPLAAARATLAPLQRVRVDVEVGGGVVLVVRLDRLRRVHQPGLAPRGARPAGAAAPASPLRAHASANRFERCSDESMRAFFLSSLFFVGGTI